MGLYRTNSRHRWWENYNKFAPPVVGKQRSLSNRSSKSNFTIKSDGFVHRKHTSHSCCHRNHTPCSRRPQAQSPSEIQEFPRVFHGCPPHHKHHFVIKTMNLRKKLLFLYIKLLGMLFVTSQSKPNNANNANQLFHFVLFQFKNEFLDL